MQTNCLKKQISSGKGISEPVQAGGQVGRGCLGSNKKNRDVISYQDAQKIVELDLLLLSYTFDYFQSLHKLLLVLSVFLIYKFLRFLFFKKILCY